MRLRKNKICGDWDEEKLQLHLAELNNTFNDRIFGRRISGAPFRFLG
ncbi:hypothetical protein CHCC20369_0614 [Bacillus licheniformis]|nr:hypothetical protein CHCC20369_0614 [Bacillus licheniformis]TWK39258.1 hypothetical protein CHCC20368_2805 [Bacillus licheniformis]